MWENASLNWTCFNYTATFNNKNFLHQPPNCCLYPLILVGSQEFQASFGKRRLNPQGLLLQRRATKKTISQEHELSQHANCSCGGSQHSYREPQYAGGKHEQI